MKKLLLCMVIVSAILAGCTTEPMDEVNPTLRDYSAIKHEARNVTYSLEKMQQAAGEVLGTRSYAPRLIPTERYIEFSPANERELNVLLNRNDLNITTVSFLNMKTEDNSEHAQLVKGPESQGKLYALVSHSTPLPKGIEYKVLAEYYNPFEDASGMIDEETAAKMLEYVMEQNPATRAANYKPAGQVISVDDLTWQAVSLPELTINLGALTPEASYYETVTTDAQGKFYATKSFPSIAGYDIIWQNGSYIIKENSMTIASSNGTITPTNQVIDFQQIVNPTDQRFASTYRGIYSASKNGLTSVGYTGGRLEIICMNQAPPSGNEDSEFIPGLPNVISPYINLYCQSKKSYDIIEMVNYALGDAAFHFNAINAQNVPTIRGSWRMFTRVYFLDKEYARIGALTTLHPREQVGQNFFFKPDKYNLQAWTYSDTGEQRKTPLFIDIYDEDNQYLYYNDDLNGNRPADAVQLADFFKIKKIAFNSSNVGAVMGSVKQYASQYGYTTLDVNVLNITYEKLPQQ